jgi:hypothetical protein
MDHQHEFVAGDVRHQVQLACAAAQRLRDEAHHGVAGLAAVFGGDGAEIIHVAHQHGHRLLAPRRVAEDLGQPFVQYRRVGQAGELVGAPRGVQRQLLALAVGGVVLHADEVGDASGAVADR